MNCEPFCVTFLPLISLLLMEPTLSQEESSWINFTGLVCGHDAIEGSLDAVNALFYDKRSNDFLNLNVNNSESLINLFLNLFILSDGQSLYRLTGQFVDTSFDFDEEDAPKPLEIAAVRISTNRFDLFGASIGVKALKSVYKFRDECHFESWKDWTKDIPFVTHVTRKCTSCPFVREMKKEIEGLPVFLIEPDGGKLIAIQNLDGRLESKTYELENFTLIREYLEPESDNLIDAPLDSAPEYLIPFAANESIGIHRDGTFTVHSLDPSMITLERLMFSKSTRVLIAYCGSILLHPSTMYFILSIFLSNLCSSVILHRVFPL